MKGTIQILNISEYHCSLYLPPNYNILDVSYPVVYMNGNNNLEEIINSIESYFDIDCSSFILLNIESKNWNADFSPWPAPSLAKNGEDFSGCAYEYLNNLVNIIKPFIDAHYKTRTEPENTVLVGYSLSGITALYSLYLFGTFGKVGSLSGSLWYDRWIEFISSNSPINTDAKIYLSLGKSEERSRNQRIAKVGNCTQKTFDILSKQLVSTENIILEWNNGGHFTEISQRFSKALLWLMNL
ncbi:alpha/beta hydrolase [Clostridium sp. PL3]|uniref:Alpha/beta hydrolase n=1 Tax=Clostridium thailandense TaxID=2794346 RepID=A0A949TN14_9CLOT|nr:alpha/beta hydrolase-fold protein [Clostridium thailandense]MBV7273452.1 alpha/beta hydrolase [Clostridium thailandense]